MRRTHVMLFILSCLPAVPLAAQTQIGGGTCSSSTLSGTYALSLTGRQLSASGTVSNAFQANGSVTFDGLSAVKATLSADTLQAVAAPLNWSGTFSMQSNCAGLVTITSGGSATLNLVIFNQGHNFLVTGNDATYAYSGSGNDQPATCSTSMVSGVYSFNATGYSLAKGTVAVNSAAAVVGLLQFDGQGNLTLNLTTPSGGTGLTPQSLTGTYSISSNCLGSATLSASTPYMMSFSVTGGTSAIDTDLFATFAQNAKFLVSGAAHAIYGQPTANLRNPGGNTAALVFAKLWQPAASARGEI